MQMQAPDIGEIGLRYVADPTLAGIARGWVENETPQKEIGAQMARVDDQTRRTLGRLYYLETIRPSGNVDLETAIMEADPIVIARQACRESGFEPDEITMKVMLRRVIKRNPGLRTQL